MVLLTVYPGLRPFGNRILVTWFLLASVRRLVVISLSIHVLCLRYSCLSALLTVTPERSGGWRT